MNGYERASDEIVPAVRLVIAMELRSRYNMTEERIASILGVAQAAVSKYLNGKSSQTVKDISGQIDRAKISRHIEAIAKGDETALNQCICSLCSVLNKFDCKFSALNAAGK